MEKGRSGLQTFYLVSCIVSVLLLLFTSYGMFIFGGPFMALISVILMAPYVVASFLYSSSKRQDNLFMRYAGLFFVLSAAIIIMYILSDGRMPLWVIDNLNPLFEIVVEILSVVAAVLVFDKRR